MSDGNPHSTGNTDTKSTSSNIFVPFNKHLRHIISLNRHENSSATSSLGLNNIDNISSEQQSMDVGDSDHYSLVHFASNEALLSTQENVDIESPMLISSSLALDDKLDTTEEYIDALGGESLNVADAAEVMYLQDLDISAVQSSRPSHPRQNWQSRDESPAKKRKRRRGGAAAAAKNGYSSHDQVTFCIICGRPLRQPVELHAVFVKHVKPPILRHMRKINNILEFPSHAKVCISDLQRAMQTRIEEIMSEDEIETAELQASAMKNLGEFEIEESNWQAPFQKKRSFGQKAADMVARFGGSWGFVFTCVSFIFVWALLNIVLDDAGNSWDPYPFILLNFFLSMLASVQAPIIMMSQNRQNEIDHQVNDYVSTIMLRAENLIRHAQAKTDLLVGPTFRRLLEIQEIEVELLQTLHQQHRQFMHRSKSTLMINKANSLNQEISTLPTWTVETLPDPHARMLLHHYFGIILEQEDLIFSRAHGDGDNYIGSVENVKLEVGEETGKDRGRLRKITYDLVFPRGLGGTLDDVLSGDVHVNLRNAFDIPQLQMPEMIACRSIAFTYSTFCQ